MIKGYIVFLILSFPTLLYAHNVKPSDAISIRFLDDNGRVFKHYPLHKHSSLKGHERRAYLEAIKEDNYKIQIINHSGKRLGLVIAVDGRNIISGQKSDLEPTERMYILGPYERNTYGGWRTDQNTVHRFFFTDSSQSYSAAFSDYSAMGVIAVAVYEEKKSRIAKRKSLGKGRVNSPAARLESSDSNEAESKAGTGFGAETQSYARFVRFFPETEPRERHFYKYEWRQALCNKGIIECGESNRFWPEQYGFAPYPENYVR